MVEIVIAPCQWARTGTCVVVLGWAAVTAVIAEPGKPSPARVPAGCGILGPLAAGPQLPAVDRRPGLAPLSRAWCGRGGPHPTQRHAGPGLRPRWCHER